MKSTTTMFKKVLIFGAMVLGYVQGNRVEAQTPCTAAAAYGCGNQYGYCGDLDAVVVKNKAGTVLASYNSLKCNTASNYLGILNQGAAFDLTAGEEIVIELTGTEWAGYYTRPGVWMDTDLNKSFSAAEVVIDPQSYQIGASATTFNVKVPCFTTSGSSYMRFRGGWNAYTLTKNNGCGSAATYGNVFDLEVNYKVGSIPVANFIVPTGPNWEGSNVTFVATNPNAGANYKWTFDKANSIIVDNLTKGTAKWNTGGKYDVKMLVDYCGIADSITKQVTITAPTQAPIADFIADNNEVELGYDVQLFDLSTYGPTSWAWEIYSPTGIGDDVSSNQNPKFSLVEAGWHKVCLTAGNSVGNSTTVCKNRYIECLPTLDNYLGPQKVATTRYGRLFDHAGPTGNYANNRKTSIDYFQILPCGAKEIRITFKELAFADANDKLRIYDSDQADPSKLVTPADGINGNNQILWDTATIVLKNGAGYITFETNGAGVDKGFIMNWESDLETPTAPEANWTTEFNPVGTGVTFLCENKTVNTKGVPIYIWEVDGNPESYVENLSTAIYTTGTYNICLIAQTCTGIDTACKNITVFDPTSAGIVDFSANNLRPVIGEDVTFTTKSDYADVFEWSIFPTTFKYVNGTSNKSQNPQIEFTQGGAYTFTLSAYNGTAGRTLTEKKVIKNKYIVCVDYCIPLTNMVSKDIAITTVKVTDAKGTILANNVTEGGESYSDYTDGFPMKMTYGASYEVYIARKTNSNDINYKVWVDWNIDGDYDDAGEEVISTGTVNSMSVTGTITVPALSKSFEGKTRMRVGASYGTFSNSPCGVNQVGEFEDYAIQLSNDNMAPQITLVGSDTVRVERTANSGACYAEVVKTTYVAFDVTEGDLTNSVMLTSDLDCSVAGVYNIDFNLTDASGNKAATKSRTIIVVLDRTGPVLSLQGNDTVNVEQCGTFTDAGAIANDAVDGDLTSAVKVAGMVDASKVGDYTLVYSVKDAQGNSSTTTRLVKVRDTQKPGIYRLGKRITNGMVINVQLNSAFVDDIYALDICNGNIFLAKTPGYNGVVNNQSRATYPIVYTSADPSMNKADEDGFIINYIVDDFIAPNIELNTNDTILHDVNEPYSSRSVTVTDNYYGPTQVSSVKSGKVDPYTLGTYVETFTASDASGNKTTKRRYVKVVDRLAPQLTAPPVSTCVGVPFWALSGLIVKDNYYSASDLEKLIKVVNHNVNVYAVGVYYVNLSVTDPSGNEAAIVSRTVYVQYPPNCQNTYLSNETLKLSDLVGLNPNPTTGKVNISYNLNNNQPLNIEVVNSVGATVKTLTVKGGMGTEEMDMTYLGTGIYFVRMTNNGQTAVKKLVVRD